MFTPAPEVVLGTDRRGDRALIFRFPFDELLNAAVKRLPGRRFDWERREWIVPARPEYAEEIFLPFSRRFEVLLNVPFGVSNGTATPDRGYTSEFGDLSVTPRFLLSENANPAATHTFASSAE